MEIQTDLSGKNRLYLPWEGCLKTVAMASSKKYVDLNLYFLPLTLGCGLQLIFLKNARENPHSLLNRFMILSQATFIAIFDWYTMGWTHLEKIKPQMAYSSSPIITKSPTSILYLLLSVSSPAKWMDPMEYVSFT